MRTYSHENRYYSGSFVSLVFLVSGIEDEGRDKMHGHKSLAATTRTTTTNGGNGQV